jgi:hypothetical protein
MRIRRCLAVVGRALALVAATAISANAGGIGISTPPDTVASPQADTTRIFYPYHVPYGRSAKANRDIQFLWSKTYSDNGTPLVPPDPSQENDLDRLGKTICNEWVNAFGFHQSDIELVCRMLDFGAHGYELDDALPGFQVNISDETYDVANKQKIDTYLYAPYESPSHPGDLQGGPINRGQAPSAFTSPNEDVDAGRAFGQAYVLPMNSLMVPGPKMSQVGDTGPLRWTRPDALQNWGFDHEFQHVLNQNSPYLDHLTEVFSSVAEAACGELDEPPINDAPYTWSLLHDSNYQAWRTFTAYVSYLYRGTDNTAAGLGDDLMARWAQRTPDHTLAGLTAQLADGDCSECQALPYFQGLDPGQRLATVLHNWRVATYANNPGFDRGQYGFALQRADGQPAFDPVRDVGWWHDVDGIPADNNVALPAEFSATPAWRTRLATFTQFPLGPQVPVSRRLAPELLGAEYAVVHDHPSLGSIPEDLVVRVGSDTLLRSVYVPVNCEQAVTDGRMLVSVISYSHDDPALYAHPEWMTGIQTKSFVTDSVRSDLEFVIPSFGGSGGTTHAVVVVVSLSYGPGAAEPFDSSPSLPIHYAFGLRAQPALAANPMVVQAGGCDSLSAPTWSPSGGELAYAALTGTAGVRQIYRQHIGSSPTLLYPQSFAQYDPDWSPRGDRILFTQQVSPTRRELWVDSLASGACAPVMGVADGLVLSPVFSPNGWAIAYVHFWSLDWAPSDTTRPSPVYSFELRRFELDERSDIPLVSASDRPIGTVRWSPDASLIYFVRDDSLLAVDADGVLRDMTPLAGGGSLASYDVSRGRNRFISPAASTARTILWCFGVPAFGCDCGGFGSVHYTPIERRYTSLVDVDGVPRTAFYETGSSELAPRWSNDGTRVAFVRVGAGDLQGDLVVGQPEYNHAPVLDAAVQDLQVEQGSLVQRTLQASDADGEPIKFVGAYLPSGATLDSTSGAFQWQVPANSAGAKYHVVFRALDPSGGASDRVVRFDVIQGSGGCPFADTWTADGWRVENSILGRSLTGSLALDAYRLKEALAVEDGRYRLRLRESEQESTTLDQVRLAYVDHAPDLRAWSLGEKVVLGTRVPPYRATTQRGEDITNLVNGSGSGYFAGQPGDTVLIDLVKAGTASSSESSGAGSGDLDPFDDGDGGKDGASGGGGYRAGGPSGGEASPDALVLNSTGILIQGRDAAGVWSTIRHRYPRENNDEFLVDTLDQGPVRMVFVGRHRLNHVGRVVPVGVATPSPLTLLTARHARLGDVRSTLLDAGDATTALLPGDTLGLEFGATPVPAGQVRDFFLLSKGVYTAAATAFGSRPVAGGATTPVAFALLQNRPNPFTGGTVIDLELPRAERVRLEVFDLAGRRVRVLAEGTYNAGRWSAEWDRRDAAGSPVRPGVYLYRLRAGEFHAERKMVLIP